MRNRTWSDVIMALMIALCVGLVAEPQREEDARARAAATTAAPGQGRTVAVAIEFPGNPDDDSAPGDSGRERATDRPSTTDRAMASAAEAAGEAVSGIEMPFFSFGADAGME